MKFAILAAALTTTFAAGSACAAEAMAANDLSFNAAVTSDYRYRGISQTRMQPALQGGADFVHKASGVYAGAWASSIKWTSDAGGDGDVEIDLYLGKRGELSAGLGYDVGVLRYAYPSNDLASVPGFVNANTTEAYAQLSYGTALVKYSHAVTNLFGFVDSKDSAYLDLAANLDAGSGVTVNLHAGRQRVANNSAASYTDWKIGVTRDFGVVTGALAYIGTNASKSAYASPANGKFLGKSALLLTLSKTF
ncbi:TorF family putative porin [Massilia sp. CMS3.1]|uniref:TorF family putative porin n=1 Tax=Massilia sp. CMS3.1 TaxID=3373083 RepID=UPI003EE5DFCD